MRQEREKQIATVADIQEFWTNVMNNRAYEMKDRLKASELLAKANGLFDKDNWM